MSDQQSGKTATEEYRRNWNDNRKGVNLPPELWMELKCLIAFIQSCGIEEENQTRFFERCVRWGIDDLKIRYFGGMDVPALPEEALKTGRPKERR